MGWLQTYDRRNPYSVVVYPGRKEVAFCKGGTLTYVHQDFQGGTSLTTDSSGTEMSRVAYFPFGGVRSQTGDLGTDKLFTGQRLDQTGLYYYGARYYDATIGRFISADAVVPDWINPQSLNRYSYCLNHPLRYVDPSGHIYGITEDDIKQYCIDNWDDPDAPITDEGRAYGIYNTVGPWKPAPEASDGNEPSGVWGWACRNIGQPIKENIIAPVTDTVGDIGTFITDPSLEHWDAIGHSQEQEYLYSLYKETGDDRYLMAYIDSEVVTATFGSLGKGIETKFTPKITSQLPKRGWTTQQVQNTIDEALHVSPATNKATGGNASAYFNADGSYVVRDNLTGEIIQISNRFDPNWMPDSTIIKPYITGGP